MPYKENHNIKDGSRIGQSGRRREYPSVSDNLGEILGNILGKDSVKIGRKSIFQRLKSELTRYTGLDPDNILIFAQPDAALQTLVDRYIKNGSRALIPGPAETAPFRMVEKNNGSARECWGESPFVIDLDSIAGSIDGNTSLVYISNPSRPAGAVYGRGDLEYILNQNGEFLLIIDEYEFEISGVNCTDLIGKYKNLAIVRKFPRLLGLASTPGEYLLASPELTARIRKQQGGIDYSGLSGTAALAALRSLTFVKRDNLMIKENMILMDTRLRGMGFDCHKTPFDYILVKFRDPDSASAYLNSRGISCRSLSSFNQLGNYLALMISSEEGVAAALDALSNIPDELEVRLKDDNKKE